VLISDTSALLWWVDTFQHCSIYTYAISNPLIAAVENSPQYSAYKSIKRSRLRITQASVQVDLTDKYLNINV